MVNLLVGPRSLCLAARVVSRNWGVPPGHAADEEVGLSLADGELAEVGTAAEDEVLDVLLAVSEAFTNAVMHAGRPCSIAVQVDASCSQGLVNIVVRDYGRWPDRTGGSGFGLPLMQALMDGVDFQITGEGT